MEKKPEDIVEPSDNPEKTDGDVVTEEQSDEEDVVTGEDLIKAFDERNKVDRYLYGSQDTNVCTWPEGYKPRQSLFSCLTCKSDPNNFAGICLGCSANCHSGHDLVELYTKRKFRCDCGTDKFGPDNKCKLYEEKTGVNEYNTYGQNFAGTYCTCGDTFPGQSDEIMFQCLMCEDWFHPSHQDIQTDSETAKKIDSGDMVCKKCAAEHPYLAILEVAEEKTCFPREVDEGTKPDRVFILKPLWRERICTCPSCQAVLEAADSTFLLDADDDLNKYEEENEEHAREVTDTDMVDELVKVGGRDAAVSILKGYNDLKQNLMSFFQEKDGKVITTDDINSFFSQIKRPRLDPDADV